MCDTCEPPRVLTRSPFNLIETFAISFLSYLERGRGWILSIGLRGKGGEGPRAPSLGGRFSSVVFGGGGEGDPPPPHFMAKSRPW